jgi:hypothetical protein
VVLRASLEGVPLMALAIAIVSLVIGGVIFAAARSEGGRPTRRQRPLRNDLYGHDRWEGWL